MNQDQKQRMERDQELEDVRRLLHTPEGFRFFRRLISKTMLFQTTFTGNSTSYLYEGKRAVGLEIWFDIVESSPDLVAKILIPEPVIEEKKTDDI